MASLRNLAGGEVYEYTKGHLDLLAFPAISAATEHE